MLDVMLSEGGVENWNSQHPSAVHRNRNNNNVPPIGGGGGYVMGGADRAAERGGRNSGERAGCGRGGAGGGERGGGGGGGGVERGVPRDPPTPGGTGWEKARRMVLRGKVTRASVYGDEGDTPARPKRERAPSMRREVRRASSAERADVVRRGNLSSDLMGPAEPLPPNEFGRFNV